jgi:hypothetical protein
MWQKDADTLAPSQQLHAAEVTPAGVAVLPAPPHCTGPAAPAAVSELAVMDIASPEATVTPVSTHASTATLTEKLTLPDGRHPLAPQHLVPDAQQSYTK